MVKRVGLLVLPQMSGMQLYFTKALAAALDKRGIDCELLQNFSPKDVKKLSLFDLIASFQSLEASFAKELLEGVDLPLHLNLLLEPALYHITESVGPSAIFATVDRGDLEGIHALTDRAFFCPHAIGEEMREAAEEEKHYDAVFFGNCYDAEAWRGHWRAHLPGSLHRVLEEASRLFFEDSSRSLAEALSAAWRETKLDPAGYRDYFLLLFRYLDRYTREKDRCGLIRAVKGVKLHVFGESVSERFPAVPDWSTCLDRGQEILFHPPVNFEEKLAILRRSKMCLNSVPFFRDGSHAMVLFGLAAGCLMVTSESRYLREQFAAGEELLFYQSGKWEEIDELTAPFLMDERRRSAAVAAGRKKVFANHTWDVRLNELLKAVDNR